jgi:hypothetical protein
MKHAPHVVVFIVAACLAASAVADHFLPGPSENARRVAHGTYENDYLQDEVGEDERHVSGAMKQQVSDRYGYSGYGDPAACPTRPAILAKSIT